MKVWGLILILILFTGCVKSFPHPTGPPPTGELTETLSPTEAPPDDSKPAFIQPHESAHPDPETDNITWTLPTGASSLRLSLPADIDDIFYNEHTGVGGYGLHAGGHPEGLDHVWIELRHGVPVKSWADGVVTDINYEDLEEEGETHVTIDYGQNLIGVHMEIVTLYVEVGDKVKRGQEIGMGMSFSDEQSSAEMSLIDLGRTDGVEGWVRNVGVLVSPYDYLEDSEKKKLVDAYKKHVLEPYEKTGGTEGIFEMFEPYQPYLTNRLFLHEGREGRLSGEWYYTGKWEPEYPNDLITFIEAEEPYYETNIVFAQDDIDDGRIRDYGIRTANFEVDYEKGQIKITEEYGQVYYGIFEIDESGDRAKLKIEYQEDSYPTEFSSNALTYIERSRLSRRTDAAELGMRDTL